jgi:hypothetical protein
MGHPRGHRPEPMKFDRSQSEATEIRIAVTVITVAPIPPRTTRQTAAVAVLPARLGVSLPMHARSGLRSTCWPKGMCVGETVRACWLRVKDISSDEFPAF